MSDNQHPDPPRLRDFQDGGPRNPYGDTQVAVVQPLTGLVAVEQQKAIAEVQARMIMARQMPRDPMRAAQAIINDCTRPSLAAKAVYSYARGGQDVSGPSIRLAEAVAQRWGNIASGIKELSRNNGYSDCVAYAWDLESGYYDERQFQIRHWRDTKGGGYAIKEERDISELLFNMGQRRKRAVLLAVIPGDIIEMAVKECEQTLHANADTSPAALLKMVDAFDRFGVTKAQIEKKIQRKLDAIRPAQVVMLSKIFSSLSDEMSTPDEWFEKEGGDAAWSRVETAHTATRPNVAPTKTEPPKVNDEAPARPAQRKATTKKAAAPEPERREDQTAALDDEIPTGRWEEEAQTQAGTPVDQSASQQNPKPEPERQRAPAAETVLPFEEWLLDAAGDTVGDAPYDDATAWARDFVRSWEACQPDLRAALLGHNAGGAANASRGSDEASRIIDTINDPARQKESDEASAPEAQAVEPKPVAVVELKTDRGKPAVGPYLTDFKTEVATLDAGNFLDFIELNRAEMAKVPPSTISLCLKALVTRGKEVGVEVPPDLGTSLLRSAPVGAAATAAPAADQDETRLTNLISDFGKFTVLADLNRFIDSSAVQSFAERMQREGKDDIIKRLGDAVAAQRAVLRKAAG